MRTPEILQLLQDVAAEVITPRFKELRSEEILEKNPGDFVTIADQQAEVKIAERLHDAYPQAFILGEEATFEDPSLLDQLCKASHAFTIDPIDGTGNFVKGNPDHAVMVAELRDGELSRSWIWQPEHKQAFVAERGEGVRRNGEKLSRQDFPAIPQGATSRKNWKKFQKPGKLAPMRHTFNSAGIDYPALLEGKLDYSVYFMPKPWDHLPGQLMLKELGGEILKLDGTPYQGQGSEPIFAAAHADRLAEIVEIWRADWHIIDAPPHPERD